MSEQVERDVREIKQIITGVVIAVVLLFGTWLLWQEAQGVKREQAADAARQSEANAYLADMDARLKAEYADQCRKYSPWLHDSRYSKKEKQSVIDACKQAGMKPL